MYEDLEKYFLLDQQGMKTFAKELLREVENKIDNRIVTSIDEEVSDKQIPSAQTLQNIVTVINENVSNCWTRDPEDTAALKDSMGLTDVDDRFDAIGVDLSGKLDAADVNVISQEDLSQIIQDAIDSTDPWVNEPIDDDIDPALVDG